MKKCGSIFSSQLDDRSLRHFPPHRGLRQVDRIWNGEDVRLAVNECGRDWMRHWPGWGWETGLGRSGRLPDVEA